MSDHYVTTGEECECDDPRYVFRVLVANEVVHEATVDCEAPGGAAAVARVQKEQVALVDAANEAAQPWRCESECPGCGKGVLIVRGPKPMERVSAQGVDPNPPVVADCGHAVMATVATRQRMANPEVDNVNVCLPCFNEDPERWRA
jgi:hypothetical protein